LVGAISGLTQPIHQKVFCRFEPEKQYRSKPEMEVATGMLKQIQIASTKTFACFHIKNRLMDFRY
jgi:hypothetical protein